MSDYLMTKCAECGFIFEGDGSGLSQLCEECQEDIDSSEDQEAFNNKFGN